MKSIIHAQRSAKMFGGKAEDYLAVHELIDLQKLYVTPLVIARFFLHHIDIGLPILQSIFGKGLIVDKVGYVPVKDILLQHLFEDFGGIITFKDHWVPAMTEAWSGYDTATSFTNQGDSPWKAVLRDFPQFTKKENKKKLEKIFNILNLKEFTDDQALLSSPKCKAIFCHSLGMSLAAKVFQSQMIGPYAIMDVLEKIMIAEFKIIPEFQSYVSTVKEKHWMFAPVDGEHLSTDKVLSLIADYKSGKDCSVEKLRPEPKPIVKEFSRGFEHRGCGGGGGSNYHRMVMD